MDPSPDIAATAPPRTDPVTSRDDRRPTSSGSQLTTEDRTMLGQIAASMLHPTLPPQATMRLQLTYGRDQNPPLVELVNAGEYLGGAPGRRRRHHLGPRLAARNPAERRRPR